MKISEYKKDASRTMSNEWHLSIFDTEELHCAIGIVTEFGELLEATRSVVTPDPVNVMEEVGDVFWYLAGFQRRYSDLDWETGEATPHNDLSTHIKEGTIEAIEVLDMYKKFAYYGRELNQNKLKSHLYAVYNRCYSILKIVGYTVEQARQINIDKLRARFPNEFVGVKANNRDLEKERNILEGN